MGFENGDFVDYAETTVDPGGALSAAIVMICLLLFCCVPKLIAWSEYCCVMEDDDDSSVISTDEERSHGSTTKNVEVGRLPPNEVTIDDDGNNNNENKVKIPSSDDDNSQIKSSTVSKVIGTVNGSVVSEAQKYNSTYLQKKFGGDTSKALDVIGEDDSACSFNAIRDFDVIHSPRRSTPGSGSDRTSEKGAQKVLPDNASAATGKSKKGSTVVSKTSTVVSKQSGGAASSVFDSRPALRVGRLRRASSAKEIGDENQKESVKSSVPSKKQVSMPENQPASFDSDDSNNSELSAIFDLTDLCDALDRLIEVAEWDGQMKRIWKLAKPFTTQAFIEGFIDLLSVGIIGHVFGVREANAYVIVMILNKLTNFINYGFYEALGILLPDASDAGDEKLTGEYLQVGIFLFSASALPVILLWSLTTEQAILWFGFDSETARIGQGFAYSFVLAEVIRGVDECLHVLLSFKGHEYYSTIAHTLSHSTKPFAILLMVNKKDLAATGILQLAMALFMTIGNFRFVNHKGWLDDCWDGFVGRLAFLDGDIVEEMVRTAIPLSISWVLSYSEWELMALFARFMGPAEVAAWGLLSILWSVCQLVIEGFTIATELCVTTHMCNNAPQQAKNAAYKAMILAVITSLIGTSLLFLLGEVLVSWLSPDPTLQRMMYEVLPLLGFGQIALSFGATCQAVLGSQGRHRLATGIKLFTTWIFVVPLAVIMVYGVQFNLLGIAASLVIGYTLRGASNAFLIFRSDWNKLSSFMSSGSGVDDDSEGRVANSNDEEDCEGGMTTIPLGEVSEAADQAMQPKAPSTTASSKASSKKGQLPPTPPTTTADVPTTKSILKTGNNTEPSTTAAIAAAGAVTPSPVPLPQGPNGNLPLSEVDQEMEEKIRKYAELILASYQNGTLVKENGDDIDNSSKLKMVIDTSRGRADDAVSFVTSLGGVEDKWIADEDDSDEDSEDSDESSQPDQPKGRTPPTLVVSPTEKKSTNTFGWGDFFSF